MDDRRSRLCVLGVLLTLVPAGCGGSSGPRTVRVSLIAPTDGATIVESRAFVTGSVQPTAAKVVIDDRDAPNHNGHFGLWMSVHPGVTHIRIDARAPGYIADTTDVAVRSAPRPSARKRTAVQQSFASLDRGSASTWTPRVATEATTVCVLRGGWQSYCECAMHYAMAAGSPSQVASAMAADESQRRLPYWLKQAIVHCL